MNGSPPNISNVIAAVIKREGGYVNDPKDPGGETKFGISKRAYPHLDIASLTEADAAGIYERDYWLSPGINRLGTLRGEAVLDFAVNAGQAQAVRTMQRALRVTADGKLGPQTVAAACALSPRAFWTAFVLERLLFYVSVILARPTSLKYLRGWFRRALEV
jgi:lysozyme family protein